jgi:PAS domain S-box-containing protein
MAIETPDVSGSTVTRRGADEAVIRIDASGRYTNANRAALELLGVTLAELRASPPDRFSIRPANESEQAALRAQWESDGSRPLIGTAGLRRADGETIRVSYAIEATRAGFRARLWQVEGSPEAPSSVFTVGGVLREWRAAERDLAELMPGTPEWARTLNEIELLRGRYQELFDTVKPRS